MIGIDTNVLVRYLVQDDPAQSARSAALLEHELNEERLGYVSTVVVAEVEWVLRKGYAFHSQEVTAAIERLLQMDVLRIEHEKQVFTAVHALRIGAGFADALIGELAREAGCTHTLTFDKAAAQLPWFELLCTAS